MPYIPKDDRRELWDLFLTSSREFKNMSKGELNYCITTLMIMYVYKNDGKSYQVLSDAIAAANDAAEEFRRRVMNPYEDKKIKENGDVYPEELLK